jgi:single-strand DNA-binding protein
MNVAMIYGRVGRDPKVFTFQSGDKVASFSVATKESYKDKGGEWREKTCWHNVKCFGGFVKTAEENITKGVEVMVIGQIENGSYEKEGVKINTSEIIVRGPAAVMRVAASVPQAGPSADRVEKNHSEKSAVMDDSIPF